MKLNTIVLLLLLSSSSFPQEIDTLYLFPDTTTFDFAPIWHEYTENAAVKLTHPKWVQFSLKSVLFKRGSWAVEDFAHIAISTGSYPEENLLFYQYFNLQSSFPEWNEFHFDPVINIYSNSFYISLLPWDLNNAIALVEDTLITNQFLKNALTFWYEGLSFYFSVKAVVDRKLSDFDEEEFIPDNLVLHNCYPNPFNPTTMISYELNKLSFVELKVYDAMGREAAVLVNEEKYPGRYSVKFNASHLSSGVYFYKLNAGGSTIIKNMILMK
jgi:hypothetical protein